jgi:phosphatidylglycerophosphate synthase
VLVISRDVAIVLTVAVVNLAVTRRTFKPSFLGKVATATYIVTGVVTLYENYLGQPSVLVDLGVWLSLAITLASSVHYVITVWAAGGEARTEGP